MSLCFTMLKVLQIIKGFTSIFFIKIEKISTLLLEIMKSEDYTKSSDSTESAVSGFIDIRQDPEPFSLGSDNIDHDTEDSIEWLVILNTIVYLLYDHY